MVSGGSNQNGEEGARAEAAEQDAGVAASASERSRRAEQPRVRGGAARATRRPRGTCSAPYVLNTPWTGHLMNWAHDELDT